MTGQIETRPLRNDTLRDLPPGVVVPSYDRNKLTPGLVHIGLGNFHRAHQAWYLHRLMQRGLALDWAIIGAGVRPSDTDMRERLMSQDCLTTLIELRPDGTSAEVCGSMIDFLPISEDNAPLIAQMSDPAIRIVSLTVTEGGYFRNAATGSLDHDHPDIQQDAANPSRPRTAFGAIIAALKARRAAGHPAFALQSCDNLRGNGDILRDTVLSLARLSDPDLADWIAENASFPNSMVDCIVPATGAPELAMAASHGIADRAPVSHENFRQWVMEDNFCAGRPPWEEVGATFTDTVHAFESMKIRILNAGHQVLANAGELLGAATISDCMTHPDIGPFFRKVQADEVVPYVDAVPGMSASDYAQLIETRFANPSIRDTTQRVAYDGSSRHPAFLFPILRDALAAGGPVAGLSLCEALWARMCFGTRDDGSVIAANDPHWEALQAVARQARDTPAAWLAQQHIYGDLAGDAAFATAFEGWLARLWRDGTESVLRAYVQE